MQAEADESHERESKDIASFILNAEEETVVMVWTRSTVVDINNQV